MNAEVAGSNPAPATKPRSYEKYIGICGICGGPRQNSGGKVCAACYAAPDLRRRYLNKGATEALPFQTYRTETVIYYPKRRVIKPREHERAFLTETTVTVRRKPIFQHAAERIAKLYAPENVWRDDGSIVFKRPASKPRAKVPRERYVPLQYPFIAKPRDEHAELLAVNAIVPHGLLGREDICQEIMIALWERRITIDQLRANRENVRAFVRSFKKDNFEQAGYALSLDLPMENGWSWHDVIADPDTL